MSSEESDSEESDHSSSDTDSDPMLMNSIKATLALTTCEIANDKHPKGMTLKHGIILNAKFNAGEMHNPIKNTKKDYVCKLCGKSYKEQDLFITHLLTHRISDYTQDNA